MTAPPWPERLLASPELFPLDFVSPEVVDVRALAPADYERASFLDARLDNPFVAHLPYSDLAQAAGGLRVAADFIFHIGHVGSTLMSRLLGRHPQVFSLREPQALRSFAEAELRQAPWGPAEFRARLAVFLALYSRTWRPEQRVVLKATSLVGEIAPGLMQAAADARALFMYVRPESYIATILGGDNSLGELRIGARSRRERLARRLGPASQAGESLSDGELAAMTWACEMTALRAAAAALGDRVLWLDFDAFLADPAAGLSRALRHLRRDPDSIHVKAMLRSGYLERYSKAPEWAYGPDLRRRVLQAARQGGGHEIRKGLAWLEAAAATAIAEAHRFAQDAPHVA